jgi:outer membrane protein assembly factor BamB
MALLAGAVLAWEAVDVQAGALIELGEGRSVPPGRPGSGRTVLISAMIILLALVGGAQSPPPSRFVAMATVSARAVTAVLPTAANLYVAEDDGAPTFSAYTLPGGNLRWRVPLIDAVRTVRWVADSGVLLATTSGEAAGTGRFLVVDSATGGVLWRPDPPTTLVDVAPGGRVLVAWHAEPWPDEVRWTDLRTGEVAWSREVPTGADVTASHDPSRPGSGVLLVTDPDGAAELLAEETGTVLASGQVGSLIGNLVLTPGPPAAAPAPVAERAPLRLLGREFLVQHRRNAGTGSLTAFDLDTLIERWSISGDLLGVPFQCGSSLCLGAAGGLRAVDPATGAVRWTTHRWQYASPLGGDRLIAYGAPGMGVLDARTGETLRYLGAAWTRVPLDGPGPQVLSRPDPGPGDRYSFSLLDPGPATLDPLGSLAGVDAQSCQVSGDLLACRTSRDGLRVWRFR